MALLVSESGFSDAIMPISDFHLVGFTMFLTQRYLQALVLFAVCIGQMCEADEPNVFQYPALAETSHELQLRAIFLARNGQLAAALPICHEAVKVAPFSTTALYHLACLQAKSGQADESLATLKHAIELGFREATHISNDPDLVSLRKLSEFDELVEAAKQPFERPVPKLGPLALGVAWVGPENTVWDESTNLLRTSFEWTQRNKSLPIIREHGEIGKRLWKWFSEGTAAGHYGDLYDNCDRDHSNLKYAQFPQLHRIEYRPEISKEIPYGLQNRLMHGGVVLGNSSTAIGGSAVWRSNPRSAYVRPASMATLTRQYFQNHLYVYPEHQDHDPGHNGGGGYGDVYPANTPYLLTSQGSSYTDQPFLDALACTMAAFRPEVKKRLVERGIMAPTLQQIFRTNYKLVREPDDYLTGLAQPSVFAGPQIEPLKMVESAHEMTLETIPPLVRIRVEQQDRSVVGRDYFETADREHLFDTPCAVARIGRSTQYRRRMIVSARESVDLNQRPLKIQWVVLRGDESLILLKPLDESGSRAELTVAWHPRRKIHPDSAIESNRVDIGVFAHNGERWSAPAFVTWFFLDNEEREYDDRGRILSVAYHGGTDAGNYTDPLLQTPKTWKDTYRYADDDRLIGWTRTRKTATGQVSEQFKADGGLVIEHDDRDRALTARAVRYSAQAEGKRQPMLLQELADEIWHYGYADPEDQIGKITSREKAPL